MRRSMRPRAMVAALAAILAGLTLGASAIAVADGASRVGMPSGGCPPAC